MEKESRKKIDTHEVMRIECHLTSKSHQT